MKGWIAIALLRLLSAPRATQSGVVGEVIQSGLASPVGLQSEVGGCCSVKDALVSSILVPQEHVRRPQYKSVESFV